MTRLLGLVSMLFGCGVAAAAPVLPFDQIGFWVGEGPQQAALAIDWEADSTEDAALVWGFRWDAQSAGAVTGEQLLRDVLAADPRLFAKLGSPFGLGVAVFGVGYDADDDGEFGVVNVSTGSQGEPIETFAAFDADGVAESDITAGDAATDPGDRYAEGWEDDFWHTGVNSPEALDTVDSAGAGLSNFDLFDGVFLTLAYTPYVPTFAETAYAYNLTPAPSPVAPLAGDFNGDGAVDAADYTVWRDGPADVNDYALWATNYGAAADSAAIPEPATAALALLCSLASAWPAGRRG